MTASPDGATISAHQITAQASSSGTVLSAPAGITDGGGTVWNLAASSHNGLQVVRNGVVDSRTSNVTLLLYYQGKIYQRNNQNGWWYWDQSQGYPWVSASGDPRSSTQPTQPPTPAPPGPTPAPTPPTGPTQPTQPPTPTGPAGTGPQASSNFLVADFSAPQNYPGGSGQQIISPRAWGVSTGGAGDGGFQAFTNSTFRNTAAKINPGLWRFNGNLPQRGDTPYFNGDGSVNTGLWNNLVGSFADVDPLGVSSVIIGVNISGVQGFSDANSYGKAMGNLARFLNSATMSNGKKFPIIGFESDNEPNSNNPLTSYFNAMASAVKAVSGNLLCCGPTTAWFGNLMPQFQQQTQHMDVADFHSYLGGYSSSSGPGQSAYQQNKGTKDIGGCNLAGLPRAIFAGEYNIDWNCSCPEQQNYIGAIYSAVYIIELMNGSPVELWSAIWDGRADGTCGVIDADNSTIYPAGYWLGQAVRTLSGPRFQVTTNPVGLLTLAVSSGSGHAAMAIVNYGQGNQNSKQVAFSRWPVNSTGNAAGNIWQLSQSRPSGFSGSTQFNGGVSSPMNFPDPSVTVVWV
jgi:hypothetical protein